MKLALIDFRLQLKHTFRVSGAVDRNHTDIGILRLAMGDLVGFGEASPSKFWGENMDMVRAAAAKIDLEKFENPLAYEIIISEIQQQFQPPKALLAALDMALFDCVGKKMGISLRRFFGFQNESPLQTSFTIGYADLDTIAQKVEEANEFPLLKLKLGTSYDVEIVEKVRSITDKPLRVDANEGWIKEEAVEKIRWLETQNVELVEQPLPAAEIAETQWVRERVNLPLIADESVLDSRSIPKIAEAFDGVNIKLMKSGGLLEAIRMIRIARLLNLKIMLGCMVESSLGIAAVAQLLPLADYADLDSHLLIKNDPFAGVQITQGQIVIANQPGLGVVVRNELIKMP